MTSLPLSQARGALFSLFEQVTARDGNRVLLTLRGSTKDAVLVSADYLRQLEAAGAAMPRKLVGSADWTGDDDVDAFLSDHRRRASEAAAQKLEETKAKARRRRLS